MLAFLDLSDDARRVRITLLLLLAAVCDISAVQYAGASFRITWLVIAPVIVLIAACRFSPLGGGFATTLIVSGYLLALMMNDGGFGELVRTAMVVFVFVFFFVPAYALARRSPTIVLSTALAYGRVSILASTVLFAAGIQERANFLFYEPSYFSISLLPYIAALVVSKGRLDWLLVLLAFLITQSVFLLIGTVVVFAVDFLIKLHWKSLLRATLLASVLGAGGVAFAASYNTAWIAAAANAGSLLDAAAIVADRGGNRMMRLQAAAIVVQDQGGVWGIGPGRFLEISREYDWSDIDRGLEWLSPVGLPPTNIVLEALLDGGALALGGLLLLFGSVAFPALRRRQSVIGQFCAVTAISFFIVLQFESTYMRSYVWLWLGLCAGALAMIPKARLARQPVLAEPGAV